MRSCLPPVRRAKPLLGTLVSVNVEGLAPEVGNSAVTLCFERIARIHRLMSFQDPGSDVSHLNREAHRRPVEVAPETYDVLRLAADISARSGGVFDVTVSPSLSIAARLKDKQDFPLPDGCARWSDIALLPNNRVQFALPLLIDLSGIAKGYAVDQALRVLSAHEPLQACVNAGGDLGHCGAESTYVRLDVALEGHTALPVVEVKDGCLASSGPRKAVTASTEHEFVDGATRRIVSPRFVSVLASTCAVADSLTKVVMAMGADSAAVLQHYAARALLNEPPAAWREVG
jgi:thiamine biosynthesis lipoprotein